MSRVATNIVTYILDDRFKKANIPEVLDNNRKHLNIDKQNKLLRLLIQYEELFNETLGDWKGESVNFELRPNAKSFHGLHSLPHTSTRTPLKRKL